MDQGTQKVEIWEIHQSCEYSMEIHVGKYFIPELPHLAHASKTSFSENLRLREYPLALESIGVFDSGWKMEELCLPLFRRIC